MEIKDTHYSKSYDRSFAIYEILGRSPSWLIKNGIYVMLLIIAILVSFGFIISYPDTVKASFILKSKSSPQKILSFKSGKLILFVKEDQAVKEGTLLAMLSSSANLSDVMYVKNETRLFIDAFSKNSATKFTHSKRYQLGSLQSEFENLVQDISSYELTNQLNNNQVQIVNLDQQILNLQKMSIGLKRQKKMALTELEYIKRKTAIDSSLYKNRVLSKAEYDYSKNNLLSYAKTVEQAEATILQNGITIFQLQKQINELKLSTQQNKGNSKSEILKKAETLLGNILIWEENYLFKNTLEGKVNLAKTWQNSDNVNLNEEIMTINPILNNTYGMAYMASDGVGKVKVNQKVYIKLDGYPSEEYGTIVGVVQSISSVKHNDNYSIRISLPNGTISTYNKKIDPKPELSGSVNILTSDLKLVDRIFNQIRSLVLNK